MSYKPRHDIDVPMQWLLFLLEQRPHMKIELKHRKYQLQYSGKPRVQALGRLEELAEQYPKDYLVFQTKQRLLGK